MGISEETSELWAALNLPEHKKTVAANVSLRGDRGPTTTGPSGANLLGSLLGELPRLDIGDDEQREVRVTGELGRGGMGVVESARQRSLDREIAIKRIRRGKHRTSFSQALLDEARVLGRLNHPSIVPVHALGTDAQGDPVLLMKRIEGELWSAAMQEASDMGADPMEWHLDVLVKVCHAIEYAHSRGLVHRDLKPENVMIGDFGEVYVLDWGVSAPLGGLGEDPLGSASLVGTPCYMPPEMLRRRGAISERIDIYLLGGILYEIITGRPPHRGDNMYEVLYAIVAGAEREFPEGAPEELVPICRRALEVEPTKRYPSVRAFRERVAEARRHRASIRLTSEALSRLERPVVSSQLLWECRFGLQQALTMWPDNEVARVGLRRCLELMIEGALGARDVAAATSLLSELDDAPELRDKLLALRRELELEREQVAELRSVAADHDVEARQAHRGRQLMWLSSLWASIGVLVLAARLLGFDPGHSTLLVSALIPPPVVVGLLWWGRHTHSPVTRRLIRAFVAMTSASLAIRVLGWRAGISVEVTLAFELVAQSLAGFLTAVLVDRRLLGPAAFCAACALVALAGPERSMELLVVGVGGGLTWAAVIWGRGAEPEITREARRSR